MTRSKARTVRPPARSSPARPPPQNHRFVLSIPVARGANWFLAGGGRRMDEEEATAAAAERIAAAAEDGTSLPVRLATDVVRFLYGGTGRREPADGGVVSASLLNAKPAVGGIGVEPRGGGVLRVLFTVASDAVADTVVRWRHELRRCVDSTAVFDVLSDREEAQHQALWPAFLAAKVAGKRAQFHRARLVVDGERLAEVLKSSDWKDDPARPMMHGHSNAPAGLVTWRERRQSRLGGAPPSLQRMRLPANDEALLVHLYNISQSMLQMGVRWHTYSKEPFIEKIYDAALKMLSVTDHIGKLLLDLGDVLYHDKELGIVGSSDGKTRGRLEALMHALTNMAPHPLRVSLSFSQGHACHRAFVASTLIERCAMEAHAALCLADVITRANNRELPVLGSPEGIKQATLWKDAMGALAKGRQVCTMILEESRDSRFLKIDALRIATLHTQGVWSGGGWGGRVAGTAKALALLHSGKSAHADGTGVPAGRQLAHGQGSASAAVFAAGVHRQGGELAPLGLMAALECAVELLPLLFTSAAVMLKRWQDAEEEQMDVATRLVKDQVEGQQVPGRTSQMTIDAYKTVVDLRSELVIAAKFAMMAVAAAASGPWTPLAPWMGWAPGGVCGRPAHTRTHGSGIVDTEIGSSSSSASRSRPGGAARLPMLSGYLPYHQRSTATDADDTESVSSEQLREDTPMQGQLARACLNSVAAMTASNLPHMLRLTTFTLWMLGNDSGGSRELHADGQQLRDVAREAACMVDALMRLSAGCAHCEPASPADALPHLLNAAHLVSVVIGFDITVRNQQTRFETKVIRDIDVSVLSALTSASAISVLLHAHVAATAGSAAGVDADKGAASGERRAPKGDGSELSIVADLLPVFLTRVTACVAATARALAASELFSSRDEDADDEGSSGGNCGGSAGTSGRVAGEMEEEIAKLLDTAATSCEDASVAAARARATGTTLHAFMGTVLGQGSNRLSEVTLSTITEWQVVSRIVAHFNYSVKALRAAGEALKQVTMHLLNSGFQSVPLKSRPHALRAHARLEDWGLLSQHVRAHVSGAQRWIPRRCGYMGCKDLDGPHDADRWELCYDCLTAYCCAECRLRAISEIEGHEQCDTCVQIAVSVEKGGSRWREVFVQQQSARDREQDSQLRMAQLQRLQQQERREKLEALAVQAPYSNEGGIHHDQLQAIFDSLDTLGLGSSNTQYTQQQLGQYDRYGPDDEGAYDHLWPNSTDARSEDFYSDEDSKRVGSSALGPEASPGSSSCRSSSGEYESGPLDALIRQIPRVPNDHRKADIDALSRMPDLVAQLQEQLELDKGVHATDQQLLGDAFEETQRLHGTEDKYFEDMMVMSTRLKERKEVIDIVGNVIETAQEAIRRREGVHGVTEELLDDELASAAGAGVGAGYGEAGPSSSHGGGDVSLAHGLARGFFNQQQQQARTAPVHASLAHSMPGRSSIPVIPASDSDDDNVEEGAGFVGGRGFGGRGAAFGDGGGAHGACSGGSGGGSVHSSASFDSARGSGGGGSAGGEGSCRSAAAQLP
ncbi:hypothetical protein FOA52_012693 [Chlamydomonas sp. UWO 241]|nr:hypothetical protein FOA52_012693 [Chlamydomonas sp. UWO 241]